tara:strand:- start:174 stop:452 length:279 start_codon:yes stop_codon:yes gene_type:complete
MISIEKKRLKVIHKLINQFARTIRVKPFNNKIDQARTLAFIKSLRDAMSQPATKLPKQLVEDEPAPVKPPGDWVEGLRKVRGSLYSPKEDNE